MVGIILLSKTCVSLICVVSNFESSFTVIIYSILLLFIIFIEIYLGRIINQGPSVLIIEDKNGYMFGGFAPVSWNLSPKWVGDDSSFLFTLTPKMRIFPSTGYNDHYQYLNLNQQTMPNGMVRMINFFLFTFCV